MEESIIVSKCKKGKSSAQHKVYKMYAPILRGVCRRYITDYDEAEDVLQEGFIKVFTHIDKFEYQGKGSFLFWMKRIIINQALNHLKKNKVKIFEESLDDKHDIIINDENDEYFDASNAKFSKEDVIEAVDKIPVAFKTVLNMAVMDGMKHKEIAELLDVAEETSRSRLTRAKQMLKQQLSEIANKSTLLKVY